MHTIDPAAGGFAPDIARKLEAALSRPDAPVEVLSMGVSGYGTASQYLWYRAEGRAWPMIGVERYAFFERAKQAYAVIQTGERRFYGCIALRKGVIPPEA